MPHTHTKKKHQNAFVKCSAHERSSLHRIRNRIICFRSHLISFFLTSMQLFIFMSINCTMFVSKKRNLNGNTWNSTMLIFRPNKWIYSSISVYTDKNQVSINWRVNLCLYRQIWKGFSKFERERKWEKHKMLTKKMYMLKSHFVITHWIFILRCFGFFNQMERKREKMECQKCFEWANWRGNWFQQIDEMQSMLKWKTLFNRILLK